MTTMQTVTKQQVQRLRTESIEHGDDITVELCDQALAKWSEQPTRLTDRKFIEHALGECVRVINEAEGSG